MPVRIYYNKCIGCGACYRECPSDCYTWNDEKKVPYMTRPNECSHCGICEFECPVNAIDVTLPLSAYAREVDKRFLG